MQDERTVSPIGYIRSDFKEKFGIPRQSGRAPSLRAELVFLPPYRNREALRGIEGFSHLWLLFDFSQTAEGEFSPTVRPPRLGGNTRVGVFASRSPFRPNRIGLSCVRLTEIKHTETDGDILIVSGADLLDGTPILDIKPYIPFTDCQTDATGGYATEHEAHRLEVEFPQELLSKIPQEKRDGLLECLADDPRPSYQNEPARVYGMKFARFEIKFQVEDNRLTVTAVERE
ncbi:MAG: tRNA (N6-threonylcarbamoyladenosine(37)-N6)-methyltransferase TrmO [Clostridia bacterium]|nr:tRNA (N6-threonylcarbamoyladenosine(37)-N6)-methyltransferase TrmO [Clostridia bacterium]